MTSPLFLQYGMPDFESWYARYGEPACVNADADTFFPDIGETAKDAKQICARCPCIEPCLQYALGLPETDDFGVFGGLSEGERRKLRRALRGRPQRCTHPTCRRLRTDGYWCDDHADLGRAA